MNLWLEQDYINSIIKVLGIVCKRYKFYVYHKSYWFKSNDFQTCNLSQANIKNPKILLIFAFLFLYTLQHMICFTSKENRRRTIIYLFSECYLFHYKDENRLIIHLHNQKRSNPTKLVRMSSILIFVI